MESFKEEFLHAQNILNEFLKNSENFKKLEDAGKLMVEAIREKKKILACGNGGSMCDAMHFAEELTGRFRDDREAIAALAIADPSHISCVSNDFGFEFVYSRYIEAFGNQGDILMALSTSGNSPNIVNAAKTAGDKGMKIVALTGKDGGELAKNCDVEIRAPYSRFSDRTQEIHIKVIHTLIKYIEDKLQE